MPPTLRLVPHPDALAPQADAPLSAEHEALVEAAFRGSKASNTRRAYDNAWADFTAWCHAEGHVALPAKPSTVAAYLLVRASALGLSSLTQRHAAIADAHRTAGLKLAADARAGYDPAPTASVEVRTTMDALRRDKGVRPNKKAPVDLSVARQLLADVDRESLAGARDAAVVLFGFGTSLRRGTLAGLDVADLTFVERGVEVLVRREKTDQVGAGRRFGVERYSDHEVCPVRALEAWLKLAGITSGPVFRGMRQDGSVKQARMPADEVARIVKRLAAAAGLDPARFAGHSLRAGHVTEAFRAGVAEGKIMETTGHKSTTMLAGYKRETDVIDRGTGPLG